MRGIIIILTALCFLCFLVSSFLMYNEDKSFFMYNEDKDEVCVILTFDEDSKMRLYEHNMSVDKNGYGGFSDSKKIVSVIHKEAKIKFNIDKVAYYSIKEGAC